MKKFKNFFIYSFLSVTVLLFFGCEPSKHPGFKKTGTGLLYKIHTPENNDTNNVEAGKVITLDMKYKIGDSLLYDSDQMPTPVMFPVMESQFEGDIYEGLRMLVKGDSATLVVDAVDFFVKTANQPQAPEFVSEGDEMTFEVKIREIQTEEEVQAAERERLMKRQQEERELIVNYVHDNEITVEPTESGIYYIEKKQGKGNTPAEEQWVNVHYTVYTLEGERLFSTRDRGEPIDFQIGKRFENEGFQEVVGLMREGGVSEALVPSSMAFGAQGAGQVIQPFTPLYYEIELIDVMTVDEWDRKQADKKAKQFAEKLEKQEAEKAIIKEYIRDNNITPTVETEEGLIYVEDVKGDGPKPVRGDKVKVHYTGMTLDGEVFDSSVERGEPFEFIVGRNMVIQGWDKGLPLMNTGSKGKLIIPFEMAYGERGAPGSIEPYSTLVFEVELLEIVEEAGNEE